MAISGIAGIIIALLIGSVLFIALGTLIYYLIYRHVINKRIERGDTSKKGMMSPVWMPVILIGLQFIFGNPLLAVILIPFLIINQQMEVEVHESMEMMCIPVEEMQEGHLSVFSMEENAGYTKQQAEGDGIRLTCFAAEELTVSWQPHYLVYLELTEEYPADAFYLVEGTLYENGEETQGFSWYPTKKELPGCIISGMQEDTEMAECTYELQITCTVQEEEGGKVLGMLSETFSLSDEKSE